MLIVNERLKIPREELHFEFARSSGPGGQNVNKVNSKVVMHWDAVTSPSLPDDVRQRFLSRFRHRITKAGAIVVQSQRHRDQPSNIEDCVEKLRLMLVEIATPPKPRKRTRPPRAAAEKRLREKKQRAQTKQFRGGRNAE